MRLRVLLAVAITCAWIAGARADVRVPAHQFQLSGLDGWIALVPASREDITGARGLLGGYRHPPSGAVLAVTRVDYPNRRAWRRDQGFFAEVEAGVETASTGYRRFHRRQHRIGRVPALDLGFRRRTEQGREVVLMRFLFFRRYTVSLTVTAPARAYRRHQGALRPLLDGFTPYFGA